MIRLAEVARKFRAVIPCAFIIASQPAAAAAAAPEPVGLIQGRVSDAATREPLAGAAILVLGTTRGALADARGDFTIASLTPATYRLEARLLGYGPLVKTDVIVAPGRQVEVRFALSANPISADTVRVRPSYFEESPPSPVSSQTFANEEIRRAPDRSTGGNRPAAPPLGATGQCCGRRPQKDWGAPPSLTSLPSGRRPWLP